jgi:pseudouridine synthase
VTVNGQVVALGAKADPERDDIRVDGRRLKAAPARRYLVMYKPKGVMTTRSDPHQRRTVIDLLAAAGIRGYFYPVGRLDYDSEGLIILTNDGAFAERVAHPRYELERTYEARVLGTPDSRDLERLARGVVIDGHRTAPAVVRVLGTRGDGDAARTVLEIVLREGRNRQVRKMCEAIGHPVETLRRSRMGQLTLKGLKPGQIRDLTPSEIDRLVGVPTRR